MKKIVFLLIFLIPLTALAQPDSLSTRDIVKKDSLEYALIKKHEESLLICDSLLHSYDPADIWECKSKYEYILTIDPDFWVPKVGIALADYKLEALQEVYEHYKKTYVEVGDKYADTNTNLAIYYYNRALKLSPESKWIEEKILKLTTANNK